MVRFKSVDCNSFADLWLMTTLRLGVFVVFAGEYLRLGKHDRTGL